MIADDRSQYGKDCPPPPMRKKWKNIGPHETPKGLRLSHSHIKAAEFPMSPFLDKIRHRAYIPSEDQCPRWAVTS